MADIYMYADETGNLDYNLGEGSSRYFGIGTATWVGRHGVDLWQATALRFRHAAAGIECPGGYHATLGTKARKRAFQKAITDVCEQGAPAGCRVVVAHWDSATSWGLQVADYALWAVQRQLERGDATWMHAVEPTLLSCFLPWDKA